jgi:hypothetical protein
MSVSAAKLDKQINECLGLLNDRQKKALLTVAQTFTEEHATVVYSDAFKKELDDRYDEYKKGGKLISEADVNKRIRKVIKRKAH